MGTASAPSREVWRDIPGHEGVYQVSNYGNVKSLSRTVIRARGPQVTKDRILKGHKSIDGHQRVKLCGPQGNRLWFIHGLVLLAFEGPCPDGWEVRHLDGNPQNNFHANLMYGTRSENMHDRSRHRLERSEVA